MGIWQNLLCCWFSTQGGFAMQKNYIVRLTDEEREACLAIVKKLKGSNTKVRSANILLKADADGPNWKDQDIADAFLCSRQCVENVRTKLVTEGFDIALNGKKTLRTAACQVPRRRTGSEGHRTSTVRTARRSQRLDVTFACRKSRRT